MRNFDKRSLQKKVGALAIVSAVIIVGLLLFWFLAGRVATNVGADGLSVKGIAHVYSIEYDDVTSVKLLSHFNVGKAKTFRSVTTYRCNNGQYASEALGEYRLDVYRNVSRYIVVTTKDGTYVLNADSAEATEALYRSLCENVRDAGGTF